MTDDSDEEPDVEEEQADDTPTDEEPAPDTEPEDTAAVDDGAADLSGLDVDGDALDPNESDDSEESDDSGDDSDGGGGLGDPRSGEWGEMYIAMCQQTTNGIIEKHGDGHTVDEEHFRSINLDDHFNAVLEKYASDSEMKPEQALIVGTAFAVGGPVALHTDLVSDLAGEFEL